METKYTPGPWAIVMTGTCSGTWPEIRAYKHEDDIDDEVARLPTAYVVKDAERGKAFTFEENPKAFKPTRHYAEIMANARLVAAAPEMAELLRELRPGAHIYRKAKALLARIDGGAA